MYLTAGLYKGRKIIVPDGVKPTLSKVRQGVFNMLNQFGFIKPTFLDMFSGSGLMALEAISRGYSATLLEINKNNVSIIKKNFINLGLKPDIIQTNALNYKTDKKFDVIYLDPPWQSDYKSAILKAQTLMAQGGVIVVEYDELRKIDLNLLLNEQKLNVIKNKKYGRALISLICAD